MLSFVGTTVRGSSRHASRSMTATAHLTAFYNSSVHICEGGYLAGSIGFSYRAVVVEAR